MSPTFTTEKKIRKVDGTFYNDAIDCPGTPVSISSCLISKDKLRITTGLNQGDLIIAKIRASNQHTQIF